MVWPPSLDKLSRLYMWRQPDILLFHTGIKKVDANLKDQLIFIEGTAPPSSIVSAIQNTGRDAILRGSGTTNSTSLHIEILFRPSPLQEWRY